MYKNAKLPIIWSTFARRQDLRAFELGVSKEHGDLKDVYICLSHQISTQLNTYGRFWCCARNGVFHHHQQTTKLWNFLWMNCVTSLQ